MKPITVNQNTALLLPAILVVERGGVATWPKVGTVCLEPIAELKFVLTPVNRKVKPTYHRTASRALEALYILSGAQLHTV